MKDAEAEDAGRRMWRGGAAAAGGDAAGRDACTAVGSMMMNVKEKWLKNPKPGPLRYTRDRQSMAIITAQVGLSNSHFPVLPACARFQYR